MFILRERASQDVRRRFAACFLLIEIETGSIAGFYSLSAGSILLTDLSDDTKKKLPRYPTVPIARVGRLAVDKTMHGVGLGGVLLHDAIRRSSKSDLAATVVCSICRLAKA